MNPKKTLIFAIVLAALALVVFLWDLPQKKAKDAKEAEGDKIVDLTWDAVTKIKIERGAETIAFEKKDDEWQMVQPLPDATDKWPVQSLISAIQYAKSTRTITEIPAGGLANYGLEPPRATITYDTGTVIRKVRIGAKTPVGDNVYIKPEEREVVYLAPEASISAIDKPVDDFRKRDLLSSKDMSLKIAKLVLEPAGEAPLTLIGKKPEKAEGEKENAEPLPDDLDWHLDTENGPLADKEVVRGMLDKIATMRVGEFVRDASSDLSEYGLDQPALVVTAVYGEGEKATPVTLKISERKLGASHYAMAEGRPYVVTVHQDSLKPLQVTRLDLRDHRLIPGLDVAKVSLIDLQTPGASYRISRSAAGWAFADESPADGGKVEELLKTAVQWRAEQLASGPDERKLARAIRGPQVSELALYDAEAKLLYRLRFSEPLVPDEVTGKVKKPKKGAAEEPGAAPVQEKLSAVTVDGGLEDTVYLVKQAIVNQLPSKPDDFKAQEGAQDAANAPAPAGQAPPAAEPEGENPEAAPPVDLEKE